jgi:preflagellin peptidase FlaK
MFYEMYLTLLVVVVFLATLFDIREHRIQPELSLGLIGASLVLKFVEAGVFLNPSILFDAVISGIVAFVILYVAWLLGLIAGGDVKLLTGIAILLPSVFRAQTFSFLRSAYLLFLPVIWNGVIVI